MSRAHRSLEYMRPHMTGFVLNLMIPIINISIFFYILDQTLKDLTPWDAKCKFILGRRVYVNGQIDTLKLHSQIYLRDISARKFLQLPTLSSCNNSDEKNAHQGILEFDFRILYGCPHHASLYHFI